MFILWYNAEYRRNRGAELANHNLWSEACRRAAQIVQAGQPNGPTEMQLAIRKIEQIPDYYTIEEARILFDEFHKRYQTQLSNTRKKHPDPQVPVDPKNGHGKALCSTTRFHSNYDLLLPKSAIIVTTFLSSLQTKLLNLLKVFTDLNVLTNLKTFTFPPIICHILVNNPICSIRKKTYPPATSHALAVPSARRNHH